jgi:hypothetical protein
LASGLPCDSSPAHPAAFEIGSAFFPRFDPVYQQATAISRFTCPGVQRTFTLYQPASKIRMELDIPAIVLDHYVAHIDLSRRNAQGMPPTAPPAPQPGDRKATVP